MRGYGDGPMGKVLAIQCGAHIGSLEPKSPQQSSVQEADMEIPGAGWPLRIPEAVSSICMKGLSSICKVEICQ